jgi:D-methionine transport system permease protein
VNTRLVLEGLLQTLWMVAPSALLAQALGTMLGLLLVYWHPSGIGARPAAYRTVGAIVNVGRSLPFVILLVLVIPLSRLLTGTSIGATAAIVPLTIGAIPFVSRLVEAALLEVPRGVVDAARAFGATRKQILFRVLVPEAVPALVRGFTVTLVSLIGYSAMAGAIGGGGLGDLAIRYGYQRFEAGILFATVIALVLLVQLSQSLGERIAHELDHRTSQAPGGRRNLIIAGGVLAVAIAVLAVAARPEATVTERTAGVLRIGASPTPHAEILEFARPLLEKRGLRLQVRVFDDYIQPNLALGDGSIDANYFQTVPYLAEFQRSRPLGIVPSTKVHIEPMALYSARMKSVADIPTGAIIAIPNDPSNSGRALNLLAKAGLVHLDPAASIRATVRDIRDNPRGLVFRELDAAQLPRVLPDVAAAVLNANYAFEAGLSPTKDGIFVEDGDSPYANVLAARPAVIESPEFRSLQEVMNSPEVKAFIVDRYRGSVLPAF